MRTRTMRPTRWVVAVLAAGLLALAGGCQDGDPDRGAASAGDGSGLGDATEAYRAYQQCMAEHGVEIEVSGPDGDAGPGGVREDPDRSRGSDPTEQEIAAADRQCAHLLPDGGELSEPRPEDLDLQREWVTCAREAGLEVIDNGDGMPTVGIPEGDEAAEQALAECDRAVYGEGGGTGEGADR